ncbi:RNA-binding protein [bacterium]|nr:MAG: RNA-binding protein [bacterium]
MDTNNNKLYVGNLSWNTTDDVLLEAFSKAGEVESAQVIKDNMSGRSKGFGFVTMKNNSDVQSAIDMWNGKDLDGREIVVNISKPREDRPRRTFGGNSNGGYRGGQDRNRGSFRRSY